MLNQVIVEHNMANATCLIFLCRGGLRLHESSPFRDRQWGILEIPTNKIAHMKIEQKFICITPSFIDEKGQSVTDNFANAGKYNSGVEDPRWNQLMKTWVY